ncbi:MAG TPA: oligosaccharide flippase family protein, partial [Chloroflexota bacterium]|nr:oligosaccharide flippase family protein [Chloroflexota bacterium]
VNLWLYASIVSDFGLGTWLTREIARTPDRARDAVGLSLGLRLVLSACALLCLTAVSFAYHLAGHASLEIVATTAILGLGLLPGALSAAGTALFNAHERMVFPATIQLFSAIVTTAAGAAALLSGHGIVALGWVSLVVNGLTAIVFLVTSARLFVPLRPLIALPRQLTLARETFPLMLNGLLNNVFFRIDIQVLQTQGTSVVGNYANAYKVTDAVGAVPSSFVLALFPVLSRRAGPAGTNSGGLLSVYVLALKLLLVVALPLSIVLTYVAYPLTLLSWGSAFVPHSAVALQILVWFLPLSFFNGLTQYVLIALGLQRRITLAFALAAVFNLSANLLLIPRYGYVAAAATTIATEVVLLVPFLLALRGQIHVTAVIHGALRTLPPALALGVLLWLGSAWHQLVTAAIGCALYPALVWLSRTFDEREWRLLLGVMRGR